jgi:hypothetical protein
MNYEFVRCFERTKFKGDNYNQFEPLEAVKVTSGSECLYIVSRVVDYDGKMETSVYYDQGDFNNNYVTEA